MPLMQDLIGAVRSAVTARAVRALMPPDSLRRLRIAQHTNPAKAAWRATKRRLGPRQARILRKRLAAEMRGLDKGG